MTTLLDLPIELLIHHIIPNLHPKDCYNLSKCCKNIYNEINYHLPYIIPTIPNIEISYN